MKKKTYFWGLALCAGLLFSGSALVSADTSVHKIPFYTGSIIPTPQKVTYYDEFIPLSNTAILLGKGIKEDDLRVRTLFERITNYGGKAKIISSFSKRYQTIISLGENRLEKSLLKKNVPNKKEGYLIYTAKKGKQNIIILKGRDKLGLLWAITSLNQLICKQESGCVARKTEVYDFPAVEKRGYIAGAWSGTCSQWAWFAVQFKFNVMVTGGRVVGIPSGSKFRQEPPQKFKNELKKIGSYLTPLGIEWYIQVCPIRGGENKIKSKSEEDFAAIFRTCCLIAEAGGNIFLLYDDTRFPISQEDKRDFGTAREADVYFVNKLYSALKNKYPEIKFQFCPPFYWGPDSNPAYPEPREDYLFAIGKRLPKEIGISWTGPRVRSTVVTREHVRWITGLIQRKPCLWQNACGAPHMYGYHHVTDPVNAWKDWYYNGFYQDMECYALNANVPHYASALLTLVDHLWNPEAYNAEKSIEEAAKKLCGVETYPALLKVSEISTWFDRYGAKVSPGAAKNIVEIRKKVAELDAAWKKAQTWHPEAMDDKWISHWVHVGVHQKFLERLEKAPDLSIFDKNVKGVKKLAGKEVNFNPIKDLILLSPYDFIGGGQASFYSNKCEKRLQTWVYGTRTSFHTMSASFSLPTAPTSDYSLIICGQDDDSEKECRIRILVNGNKIFEGANPFVQFGWSRHEFPVKASLLKNNENSLLIQNIEESSNTAGPPWFMLNYAVIREKR